MRYVIVLTILLLQGNNVVGCDACGCSISGQGIGLMTNYRTNLAGIRYFNIPFHAAPSLGIATNDVFHLKEAFMRYELTKKFKISFAQPYRINVRRGAAEQDLNLSGIGDTRLIAHFAAIDKWVGTSTKLYWEVGAGMKLPTGKYDAKLEDKDLPDNFNIGNGSWGGLFQTSLVISKNQFGINWTANAQINGETSAGYHFGNQFSSSLILFHEKGFSEKGRLVPYAGLSSELIADDKHANEKSAHGTGGHGVLALAGLNIGWDRWQLGAAYLKPINQNYSDGEVVAKDRYSIDINYYF